MWYQQRAGVIGDLVQCQDLVGAAIDLAERARDNGDTQGQRVMIQPLLDALDLLHRIEAAIDVRPATGENVIPFHPTVTN